MHDHLLEAVQLAEAVRYSGDRGKTLTRDGSLESSRIHYQFNENGLRLSSDMTPGVFEVLTGVCTRLRIDLGRVLAYVYASPEIQAGCYSAETSDCLISVSSGLIELMAEDELAFVVGHEVGHFLLGHGADTHGQGPTTEALIQSRSKEISADRLGILACSSKDAAFRALIKTTAGLDERYLRFDVSTYLDQIRQSASGGGTPSDGSTHPSLVLRCRALLWFSMSHEYHHLTDGSGGEAMSRVDERIYKDMQKFVDGPAHQRIADARETLQIWLMASAAIRDGSLDRREQRLISDEVGGEILDKMLELFAGSGKAEVALLVKQKLVDAISFYRSIAPTHYGEERPALEKEIANKFAQPDFSRYVNDFLNG